jgi:hypothetical protein
MNFLNLQAHPKKRKNLLKPEFLPALTVLQIKPQENFSSRPIRRIFPDELPEKGLKR